MDTRRLARSFSARCTVLGGLTAIVACHPGSGRPILPSPQTEQVEVGYGSRSRRDLTGASAGADADKLMSGSPRTVTDMLVGRFAGVEVKRLANGGTTIRIRGSRSLLANQEPLLVVDGMPQHNGTQTLMDLSPHDVRRIEVLKDASASAVYGSRGANGVILIATRHAR